MTYNHHRVESSETVSSNRPIASLTYVLPIGASLQFDGLTHPVTVIRGLGSGTQGQVYEVDHVGERVALKWYFPATLSRDPNLENRLRQSIQATAPSDSFLWPIALLRTGAGTAKYIQLKEQGYGYLMPLRPSGYVGAHEHYGGHINISLQNAIKACFYLADAFHQLHLKGLCYKDISIGNLFLDPNSGKILICDNDNVDVDGRELGSVLGTPGFMAPEILLGHARPGVNSDLFSLAVLIFRLLTRHDPLKGRMELEIHCLDEPAKRYLYGEDPVFVFDPADNRNRPDPIHHSAVLITWPIYPPCLQQVFIQTFCEGMKQPQKRALTGQWTRALATVLNQRVLCPKCKQENFPEQGVPDTCWSCGAELVAPMQLRMAAATVAAQPENELQPHHFNRLAEVGIMAPIGRICSHPSQPGVLGLENLSPQPWSVELINGQQLELESHQRCNLAAVQRLHTPAGPIEVLR